jgi:hypothetical protein
VRNVPLHVFIQLAYNAKDYQIVGEPAWANSERYDVTAKTENNASFEQMRPMLRSLLAERFNLGLRRSFRSMNSQKAASACRSFQEHRPHPLRVARSRAAAWAACWCRNHNGNSGSTS